MITSFLIISAIINIVFLFYSRWLIKIISAKEEDMRSLARLASEYTTHVKSVHEMEMFYGDQTLQGIIKHGEEFVSIIENLDYLLEVPPAEEDLEIDQ